MLTIYKRRSNSQDYAVGPGSQTDAHRRALVKATSLLRVRKQTDAANVLSRGIFEIRRSTDEDYDTHILYARVTLPVYEELRTFADELVGVNSFHAIVNTLAELDVVCTAATLDLLFDSPDAATDPNFARRLTKKEINTLIYKYMGVDGGYLADFSYAKHRQFYMDLDLDKNPDELPGTTRERFAQILTESSARDQATILRGVLERFPVGSHPLRTGDRVAEIHAWITRLQGTAEVPIPRPIATTATVEHALADAAMLIDKRGATSGVDRLHTAFHGYLLAICASTNLAPSTDAGVTELMTMLRERHPALQPTGPRADDIRKVLRAMASIVDALNPLRNRATAAHPNVELLERAEAMLVINAVRTLFHYVETRLSSFAGVDRRSSAV
jgi:hypothetical protein